MIRITLAAAVALVFATGPAFAQHQHGESQLQHTQASSPAASQTEAAEPAAPQGGTMQQVGSLMVETVIELGGLRVFVYDQQGQPVELNRVRGLATLQVEGDAKRYRYDLFPEIGQDQSAASLAVAVDLSRMAGRKVSIDYQLIGLPGTERRPAKFTAVSQMPLTEAQQLAADIESQRVCPVSGKALGSMGNPVAVALGNQTLYVCCQGCVAAVEAEPAKYLALVDGTTGTVPPGDEEVRPGVYKVSAADQPFIAAQQKCPVMDEPLNAMGGPFKVHADGKAVYICCPGCAKKVAAEPAKYLQVLAGQGITPPALQVADGGEVAPQAGTEVRPGVFKATAADNPFVALQKTCPVMDEPLDTMGGPYRVDVEGRAVYICCPGCAKKLQAEPAKYLAKLKEQGITPPAVK
jgi:YHS domain-containing protein